MENKDRTTSLVAVTVETVLARLEVTDMVLAKESMLNVKDGGWEELVLLPSNS